MNIIMWLENVVLAPQTYKHRRLLGGLTIVILLAMIAGGVDVYTDLFHLPVAGSIALVFVGAWCLFMVDDADDPRMEYLMVFFLLLFICPGIVSTSLLVAENSSPQVLFAVIGLVTLGTISSLIYRLILHDNADERGIFYDNAS